MKKRTRALIVSVGLVLAVAGLWTALPFVQPASAQQVSSAPQMKYRVLHAVSETDLETQLNAAAGQGVDMVEQLFGSKTRVKLLSLFLNNPGRSYYVREITRKLGFFASMVITSSVMPSAKYS